MLSARRRERSIRAVSVGIDVNTSLASATACSTPEAGAMPRALAIPRRSLLMSKPETCQPADARRAAIGSPISPRPIQVMRFAATG
jgi:hypothetical protein